MDRDRGHVVVVETGPSQVAVFQAEAQGLHQVKPAAGVGTEPDGVPGIGWNLRLKQNNIKHLACYS